MIISASASFSINIIAEVLLLAIASYNNKR